MKNIYALILFAFTTITGFTQKKQTNDKRFAGLNTAFARILRETKAAGFAVAVVKKNKIIYAKGFGYRDMAARAPVTPNTQFAIGSCTKAFTSSLIGLLEKDGKLKLDDLVRKYVPQLNFFNNDMNDHITLRDLMCHRTGLPGYDYDYSWYFFNTPSRDSLLQRIKYMEPIAQLRQTWQYNNFMFLLLGVLVEKISGSLWEENIRTKIIQPLGMSNTNVSLPEWMKNSDIATGYTVSHDSLIEKMEYFNISGMAPAGSINSSVNDMAKWVITWINGGKYGGKQILPSEYVAQAIAPQMTISEGAPTKINPDLYFNSYGLGWFLTSYRGHYSVEHGGNIDGFTASTSFFPTDSIGIIVLCNQDGSTLPNTVRNLMADKLLGLKYRDWQTELYGSYNNKRGRQKWDSTLIQLSDKKIGTKPSHATTDYEGSYSSAAGEEIHIRSSDDSLFARMSTMKFWLRHYHYDIFEIFRVRNGKVDTTEEEAMKLIFQMDRKGNIASIGMPLVEGKQLLFNRIDKWEQLTTDSMQKYTGYYLAGTTDIKVYIKNDSTLYLFVPGQPEYEIVPSGKHKFSFKILQGFSVLFTVDPNGKATEAILQQPNGSFKAIRKIGHPNP